MFSAPVNAAALLRIIEIIDGFSFDLLSSNMLFRGALVRGPVLHTSDYVFGPALVAAYRQETEKSFHPRITLDNAVFNAASADPMFSHYVVADSYDIPYLNPFARWQNNSSLTQEDFGNLVRLQSIIATGLMAGSDSPSIGEKYKWLARKLNRFIASLKSKPSLEAIIVD